MWIHFFREPLLSEKILLTGKREFCAPPAHKTLRCSRRIFFVKKAAAFLTAKGAAYAAPFCASCRGSAAGVAAAGIAAAVVAGAEEQQKDDDPPPAVAEGAESGLITRHNKTS